MRVPSRRGRTNPARASTRRCCDVLATLCEISPAISSTERSPCASTSTISARRPLPSACATDASASNRAAFASPLATSSSYHLNNWKATALWCSGYPTAAWQASPTAAYERAVRGRVIARHALERRLLLVGRSRHAAGCRDDFATPAVVQSRRGGADRILRCDVQVVVELVERLLNSCVAEIVTNVGADLHAVDPVAVRRNVGQIRICVPGCGHHPEQHRDGEQSRRAEGERPLPVRLHVSSLASTLALVVPSEARPNRPDRRGCRRRGQGRCLAFWPPLVPCHLRCRPSCSFHRP